MPNTVQSSQANRRSSRRLSTRRTATIEICKGALGLGKNIAVQLLDISEGGVRAIVSSELLNKQEVEVTLSGYGVRKSIKRLSAVSWVHKLETGEFAVGIHFDKALAFKDVATFSTN